MDTEGSAGGLRRLVRLVARLRDPGGCPWDREQSLTDVRAYLLEEAHEVAAAIDEGGWGEMAGELGDLLFQIAFVIRLGEEAGALALEDIVAGIEEKMIARHPHVFGGAELEDAPAVHRSWERRKLRDKEPGASLLAGVPRSLPALLASYRMTQKAAGVGFDWPDAEAVLAKLDEELGELRRARGGQGGPGDPDAVTDELGDLLFTVANLARHLGVDPEAALAQANSKFRRRFQVLERELARRGKDLAAASPEEMEALWERAKGEPG